MFRIIREDFNPDFSGNEIMPGDDHLLTNIKQIKPCTLIVTNSSCKEFFEKLEKNIIFSRLLFNDSFVSDYICKGDHKFNRELGKYVTALENLKNFRYNDDEILVFEDSKEGTELALKSGLKVILVQNKNFIQDFSSFYNNPNVIITSSLENSTFENLTEKPLIKVKNFSFHIIKE
ncbi:33247_t:CDS:1 [Gigaspora margarita]|uniref:33247_t:CDS:1 n=1 Tax=Gigaspora margarita TaxID=4874 RepID=A0ABM8W5L4_GIGMA|nr:33247_t:CDS:1 [Gigaspora margarita]